MLPRNVAASAASLKSLLMGCTSVRSRWRQEPATLGLVPVTALGLAAAPPAAAPRQLRGGSSALQQPQQRGRARTSWLKVLRGSSLARVFQLAEERTVVLPAPGGRGRSHRAKARPQKGTDITHLQARPFFSANTKQRNSRPVP